MKCHLIYTDSARKDLRRLSVELQKRIVLELDFFIHQNDPLF